VAPYFNFPSAPRKDERRNLVLDGWSERHLIGCRRSGSEVRIDVYDSGIGIAPEQLHRIFEAFERIDSARCEGLGIGLFVVRRAVGLLDHRIEISSAVSQGSRFSIFAPRSR